MNSRLRTSATLRLGAKLAALSLLPTLAAAAPDTELTGAMPMRLEIRRLPEAVEAATTSPNPEIIIATPAADEKTEKRPLLIYLHGGGAGGSDINKLREELPIKYFNSQKDQPFVIVVPQCMAKKEGERAIWEAEDLDRLFGYLKDTVPFDESRVYLTGFSMGGYGTWAWASASPQHFAAIVTHAGGLGSPGPKDVSPDLDAWVARLAVLPVWIFHGANGKVVPAERSERMFKALRAMGAKHSSEHLCHCK